MRGVAFCAAGSEYCATRFIQRAMNAHRNLAAWLTLYLLCVSNALGQNWPPSPPSAHPTRRIGSRAVPGAEGAVLLLSVYNENHVLIDRQAVVKLTNKANQNVLRQTTQEKSLATFSNLMVGEYEVEVSAFGYLTGHQQLTFPNDDKSYPLEITLKPDPTAIEIEPPRRQRLPAKARKNLERGLRELKAGRLNEARKKLEAAYEEAPSSSEVNFLLGYLCFQRNDFEHSGAYLSAATRFDPQNLQALTLLGRLYLQNKDYDAARANFEQAVKVNPENWMAHNLLADVYLKQNQSERAKEQAALAIEKSHGGGYAAQVLLAEALTRLGQDQAAIQALQTYLQNDSTSQTAAQARSMMAELQQRDAGPAVSAATAQDRRVGFAEVDRMLTAASPVPSLESWHPVGVEIASHLSLQG